MKTDNQDLVSTTRKTSEDGMSIEKSLKRMTFHTRKPSFSETKEGGEENVENEDEEKTPLKRLPTEITTVVNSSHAHMGIFKK